MLLSSAELYHNGANATTRRTTNGQKTYKHDATSETYTGVEGRLMLYTMALNGHAHVQALVTRQ
jgi:hypothetical protein